MKRQLEEQLHRPGLQPILMIDNPTETGCYGFLLHIGRLRLSLSWQKEQP